MYREFNYNELTDKEIISLILSLNNEEHPLIFRDALKERNEDDWSEFLIKQCKLKADLRQYTINEKLSRVQWWEISNQKDKDYTYAHSTTHHPFHNDNAWFGDPAEVNLFIIKKQVPIGGEQIVYPVSRVIDDVKRLDLSLFNDLISTPVTISKGEDDYQNITPILLLKDGGRSYWNYYRIIKTDKFINELCERFFAFLKSRETSNSVYSIRCEAGDVLIFHDQKMMHGRKAFKATSHKERIILQSMWRLP